MHGRVWLVKVAIAHDMFMSTNAEILNAHFTSVASVSYLLDRVYTTKVKWCCRKKLCSLCILLSAVSLNLPPARNSVIYHVIRKSAGEGTGNAPKTANARCTHAANARCGSSWRCCERSEAKTERDAATKWLWGHGKMLHPSHAGRLTSQVVSDRWSSGSPQGARF